MSLETSSADDSAGRAAPTTSLGDAPATLPSGGDLEHGEVCCAIGSIIRNVARANRWGRVAVNNACVYVERNPDVIRRPDVAFYSSQTLPFDAEVAGVPDVPPDVVFEVRSPGDRSRDLLKLASEYLAAGVHTAVFIDPATRTANVFMDSEPILTLGEDDVVPLRAPLERLNRTVAEWLG